MTQRRVLTLLLPLLVALPLAWAATGTAQAGSAADAAGPGEPGPATTGTSGTADAAMAATVAPGTVWPNAAPCASGTGVHDFSVSGAGFPGWEPLTVTVGHIRFGDITADGAGAYAATYPIHSLPAGQYPITVTGAGGGRAVGEINVGYSGCRSVANGRLRVTGAGFTARDEVGVRLDGDGRTTTTTAGDAGEFDVRIVCPAGTHTLAVADRHDRELAFAAFPC